MVLAGFGMVTGGIAGGRLADLWKPGATAALSQGIATVGLLLVFLTPGNHVTTAVLTFTLGFALFFNASPQQLLMVQAGEGGGELIAGAAVQIAFNFGNAVGSIIGGAALTATAMNYHYTGVSRPALSRPVRDIVDGFFVRRRFEYLFRWVLVLGEHSFRWAIIQSGNRPKRQTERIVRYHQTESAIH